LQRDRLSRRIINVADDDVGARRGEVPREFLAKTTRGAGDRDRLAGNRLSGIALS
jgi:hypothetical protein